MVSLKSMISVNIHGRSEKRSQHRLSVILSQFTVANLLKRGMNRVIFVPDRILFLERGSFIIHDTPFWYSWIIDVSHKQYRVLMVSIDDEHLERMVCFEQHRF